jgi:two-component system chemotaxis response regulator CheY
MEQMREDEMPTAVVIDDSAVMRKSLKSILESAGYTVVGEGASGDDAQRLYETFRPTLMTLDIVMPGKDGITAATELIQRYPEAVVVMCSSLSSRDKIIACQKAGVKHYMLKPFDADKVRAIAQKIAGRATPAQPATSGASR